MDLKKFIKQTTTDIEEAIQDTPSVLGVRGTIHFDVAVIADESIGVDGGVKVIGIAEGNISGKLSNQTTTRLQFDIQTKKAINPSQSNPYNPKK